MLAHLLGLSLASSPAMVTLQHTADLSSGPGAGQSCHDEAWLEGNVTARLGYSPFAANASVAARTRVRCKATGCEARLELERPGEPPRERTLSAGADQCGELMESLALALALALDPRLMMRPQPPPPREQAPAPVAAPPPAPPSPPVVSVPTRVPAPPPLAPAREPIRFQGSLSGHASVGLSPFASGGAAVAVGLRYGWFGLSLEGRFDAPASATAPTGGTVSSSVLLGSLIACSHHRSLGLCLTASGGALHVQGDLPLGMGRSTTSPLFLPGARVVYEWMYLPWLGLSAHVQACGVVTHTTIRTNAGPVWATSQVAGNAGLGALVKF